MNNACKKSNCWCEHKECDFGWINFSYVTHEEKKLRNGEVIVVITEREGVKFCPQCDPERASIQETSSTAEEMQRRLSERTPIKRAETYKKQEAEKTRIL